MSDSVSEILPPKKRFVPKATRPIVKEMFSDDLLKKLQEHDNKIKRSTLRGCYKSALLRYVREQLKVKRLPKRANGQSYHKLSRWALLELLVNEGIKDFRLTHKDFWAIRKTTKHTRKGKDGKEETVEVTMEIEKKEEKASEEQEQAQAEEVAAPAPVEQQKQKKARAGKKNAKAAAALVTSTLYSA